MQRSFNKLLEESFEGTVLHQVSFRAIYIHGIISPSLSERYVQKSKAPTPLMLPAQLQEGEKFAVESFVV